MSLSDVWIPTGVYVSYVAAGLAVLLGIGAWIRKRGSWANASFAVGMIAFAVEGVFVAQALQSEVLADHLRWQRWRFIPLALAPAAWLMFSLTYSRGNPEVFVRRWRFWVLAAAAIPVGAAVFFLQQTLIPVRVSDDFSFAVVLAMGMPAYVLQLFLIGALVIGLMNLERTFRASVGTLRWRIKFVIVGLAVLFVTRIYSSSQSLVLNVVDLRFQVINSAALLLTSVLLGISFARTQVFGVEVYPSHAVLRSSLTAFLAGLYLFVVGVLAKVVGALGGSEALPLQAFVIMVAMAGLALLLMSDRVRLGAQQFVSRHFRRPSYDYRDIWNTFTERISRHTQAADLCPAVVQWLSDRFEVLSASILLCEATQRRFIFGASTVVREGDRRDLVLSETDFQAMKEALAQGRGLHDLESIRQSWAQQIRETVPSEFKDKGGRRHVLALLAGDELLGLVVLGDRVRGRTYSHEDQELLTCLGNQLAASLFTIRLSERSLQAREMETLQTMSTFFAHDLKNTASTLSLMLQNLPKHYDKPEYREDALKALGRCVGRINELVGQLTVLRKGLELQLASADLNAVAAAALDPIEVGAVGRIQRSFGDLPTLAIDAEQIQKVISNLVLNALEASEPEGRITVSTEARDGWVVLAVSDPGPGISHDFIEKHLFRPFQTTKKRGIGIGLFHSKAIVEAHGGAIRVQSELGVGTTFEMALQVAR